MSKPMLFEYEIQEGKRFVDVLCEVVHLNSALWLYREESESWHLILALDLYDDVGPLKTYEKVLGVFKSITPSLRIEWGCLEAKSSKDEMIKCLSETQKTYDLSYTDKHISNRHFGKGISIDEAYIYFIDKQKDEITSN